MASLTTPMGESKLQREYDQLFEPEPMSDDELADCAEEAPATAAGGAPTPVAGASTPGAPEDRETDEHRLQQRQKQIDFGKNTLGYQRYLAAVPKHKRRTHKVHGYALDPVTPDITQKCSKRTFDGQVRKWRQAMHQWDPEGATANANGSTGGAEPMALDAAQPEMSAQKDAAPRRLSGAAAGAGRPAKQQRISPAATKKRLFKDAFAKVASPHTPHVAAAGALGAAAAASPATNTDDIARGWVKVNRAPPASTWADAVSDEEDMVQL